MDLSIIIPARCEEFLSKTIEDILEHIEADTEVIATLDGEWSDPPIPQHERVNVIYVPETIGQRAGQNIACRLARGKYVMKVDAHCAFDQGFDRKMIEFFKKHGDDITAVPVMRNLHVFDWKCFNCGKKWYQDAKPENCDQCFRGDKIRKKMLWQPRRGTRNASYCFNAEPRFMYFKEYQNSEAYKKTAKDGYNETMSLQGSCFMCTRENYWKKELCDETMGNWGNQGIEVACKTWLSGGRVLVNHETWYAHLFRTKADFGFPWPVSGRDQQKVKANVKSLFWDNKWPQMKYPISWLVEKFRPIIAKDSNNKMVEVWTDKDLKELKKQEDGHRIQNSRNS